MSSLLADYMREFNEMGINSVENPVGFGSPDWPAPIGIYYRNSRPGNNKNQP